MAKPPVTSKTRAIIELISTNSMAYKKAPNPKIMTRLERVGFLVSTALREDVSDSDRNECIKLIKDLVCRHHSESENEMLESVMRGAGFKTKPRPEEFVYLMHHGLSDVWKIGRSNDPTKRRATLQHEDPRITLAWQTSTGDVPASHFESWLHKIFKNSRLQGEWFELNNRQIQWIKNKSFDDFKKRKG